MSPYHLFSPSTFQSKPLTLFSSWTPLQPATANVPAEGMKNVGVGMAPMNRTGMPIEIATAYIQLASPLGSYFTGECIHGTGGIEMQG